MRFTKEFAARPAEVSRSQGREWRNFCVGAGELLDMGVLTAATKPVDLRQRFAIIASPCPEAQRATAVVLPFIRARAAKGLTPPVQDVDEQTADSNSSARWQSLMVAAQAGDQKSYAVFLKEASKFVRVIAWRFHRDPAAIEDVVQETLMSLHRVRHTYEPGRPVEPWVAAVARARAIDALRARKRRAPFEHDITTEAMSEIPDTARHSEDALAARGEIDAALAALSPGQRAAVRMLKIDELSLSEAAAASGQSIPALKSLLHRAMLTLRASLGGGNDA